MKSKTAKKTTDEKAAPKKRAGRHKKSEASTKTKKSVVIAPKDVQPLAIENPRTAVLFICHAINRESLYRWDMVKKGAEAMGYDIFWALDKKCLENSAMVPDGVLPEDINFYMFSLKDYQERLPYCVFTYGREVQNMTPAAIQLFHEDHSEYDFIWGMEYDVVYSGEWKDVFSKYDSCQLDFIAAHNEPEIQDEIIDSETRKKLEEDGLVLCKTLNFICRTSSRMLEEVKQFMKKYNNGSGFFEWSWATSANAAGYDVVEMEPKRDGWSWKYVSPAKLNVSSPFNILKRNTLYHSVKMDTIWMYRMMSSM